MLKAVSSPLAGRTTVGLLLTHARTNDPFTREISVFPNAFDTEVGTYASSNRPENLPSLFGHQPNQTGWLLVSGSEVFFMIFAKNFPFARCCCCRFEIFSHSTRKELFCSYTLNGIHNVFPSGGKGCVFGWGLRKECFGANGTISIKNAEFGG